MQMPAVQTSLPRIGCFILESFLATAVIASSAILRLATARAMASLRSPASVGGESARPVRPLVNPLVAPVDFEVSRSIGATSCSAAVGAAAPNDGIPEPPLRRTQYRASGRGVQRRIDPASTLRQSLVRIA